MVKVRLGSGLPAMRGIQVVHRGTSVATWSCLGDRLKIWVGTVLGPTTNMGRAIWAGSQVKQSHWFLMGRATLSGQGLERLEPASPQATRCQDTSRITWLLSPDQQQGRHRSWPGQWWRWFQVARHPLGTLRVG